MKVNIVAHPNSKRPRVETDLLGTIHVYVNTPPLEGRANSAVADALTEYFKTKKSKVILIRGTKSKQKLYDIDLNK